MDKERLERIKERVNYHSHLDDDIVWLIEQAERVQELEGFMDKSDEHLVRCGKQIMKLTDEKAELEYQNKRYREALRFYADVLNYYPQGDNVVSKITEDYGSKALEVLHG